LREVIAMTEMEWLASDTPIPMLQWLTPRYRTKNRYVYRTALLFGLACFERVLGYSGNAENWILRRAEELADDIPDVEPHITAPHVYELRSHSSTRSILLLLEPKPQLSPVAIATEAAEIGRRKLRDFSGASSEELIRPIYAVQAKILRDIIGNPFHRIVFDPAWLTSDVTLLARGIYDTRAFERMPILADALQDAGCDNEDILTHCRDANASHVRGCWVVDLVLGKS
jgi:hypothetical protein